MKPRKRAPRQRPLILRGSLIRHRRRCGRPNCHCVTGSLHESWVLSIKRKGRTEFIQVGDDRLALVEAALKRYRQAVSVLDERAGQSLQMLRARTRHG